MKKVLLRSDLARAIDRSVSRVRQLEALGVARPIARTVRGVSIYAEDEPARLLQEREQRASRARRRPRVPVTT